LRPKAYGVQRCVAATLALLSIAACSGSNSASSGAASPASPAPTPRANAAGGDWLAPGKTFAGNRLTTLTQISPANVATLKKAWVTQVRDDGEEEASPIVSNGVVYVSTSHDNVLALDGTTGALKWAFGYNPAYELEYAVNRGVGLSNGKLYIVTQDCRLVSIDAATGTQVFNVPACHETKATWYSTASYVYKNRVIVGTAGGDIGGTGLVSAFDANDGSRLWDWHTVAQPGDPANKTWPGKSWVHGGAAVWAGLSIDADSDTLYAAPGNPAPNLTTFGRKGENLYADSVVALDISGAAPKLKWYYKVSPNDVHDNDPAMPPVLFSGKVGGVTRKLLAVGDKAGDFVILDRTTGKLVSRLVVSDQRGIFNSVPTVSGTIACPSHGGGIEWNGGSYDASTNYFIVPSTQECAVWKIIYTGKVPYIPGQPYSAGPLPPRSAATGVVSAIDVSTGKVAWRKALPYSAQGGVLVTNNGLLFTSDLGGRVYAFETKTGKELWHDDTGSAIVAPISAYLGSDGNEYLVVEAGEAGNQQTPNLPKSLGARVVAYRLGVTQTAANDTSGQPTVTADAGKTESEAGSALAARISLPYTDAQMHAGEAVYKTQCLSCHGAQLQGVSGPALTGAGFARSGLNVTQIYGVVSKQMPLTAPGSLRAADYAALMAYILAYACVQPAAGGKPFPVTPPPQFSNVQLGADSCPPE
jgi:alcohol dehydrogenase (cytochrome c)